MENKEKYYTYNSETKKLESECRAQIDPLESEAAGYVIYCGLPANATYKEPLAEKEGFDVVWNGEDWEYREIKKESKPYEPTELDKAREAYYIAQSALAATDYRALKYVDGEYTEEEYAVYREERKQLRQAVRDAEEKIKELEI